MNASRHEHTGRQQWSDINMKLLWLDFFMFRSNIQSFLFLILSVMILSVNGPCGSNDE